MNKDARLSVGETNILQICCTIEETFADMYRYFASIYTDDPEINSIWNMIANEEDEHASQFRLACRLHGSGMQSVEADLYRVKTVQNKLCSIRDSVKKTPPPLKEALRVAIVLEKTLAEYHMNTMVNFSDHNLERLFVTMRKNDVEHIERLEQAYLLLETV